MTVVWVLLLILGMIGLGVPIAFALAAVSILILAFHDLNMLIAAQRMYQGVQSFPLLAVPLFILAGVIMNRSGISEHLVEFARNLVGAIKGGLSAVNIVTSMFFAGMSGTSMSDTAAVGGIMIPPMIKRGFSRAYAGAVTASSSTIGIIIPPSVPMVVLAAFLGISTGGLFAAGLFAGLLLGFGLIFAAWLIAIYHDHPTEQPFNLRRLLWSGLKAAPALGMPVIILGGIYSGVFTATEAASISVAYAFLVEGLVYRNLTWSRLTGIFESAAILSCVIFMLIGMGSILSYFLTLFQVPGMILQVMEYFDRNVLVFLLIVNITFMIAGMFLDPSSAMLILVPPLFPVAAALGVDPVHFGMIVTLNIAIAMITPPFGLDLFVASTTLNKPVIMVIAGVLPFILVNLLVLAAVTLIPELSTFFPAFLGL